MGKVIMWDSGTATGEIVGFAKRVLSCDLRAARPLRLAMGGDESTIAFFEGPPFKLVKNQRPHNSFIFCIRYAPDGEYFLSVSADKRVCAFDGKDGNEITP
jgi:WD40 repeat protein